MPTAPPPHPPRGGRPRPSGCGGDDKPTALRGIKAGAYIIFCDQAGHTEAGQTGTLTIA